jgi:nucleotide-binding universal stress UspA family protein
MLHTILVGLDGSSHSDTAVELGIRWSKKFDCQLTGVGVIDEPEIRAPQGVPVGGGAFKQQADEAKMAEATRRVEQFLSAFSLKCSQHEVPCKLLEEVGIPYEEILLEAQRYDLIMIGKETQFHFETRIGADDTVEALLRRTPRPVVVMPEVLPTGDGVLIAYDGSLNAARSLQSFANMGLAALGDVHILSSDKHDKVAAAKIADRADEFLGFHGIKATVHAVVDSRSPGELIVEKSKELNVELIVMGSYGRSKLAEFFLGSVTRKVLGTSTVPMFLYH